MDIVKISNFLESAKGPDPRLDALLGMLIGYKLLDGLPPTKDITAKLWASPDGTKRKMPPFTASTDTAWDFATELCGGPEIIAVAIDDGGLGSAQVNEAKALKLATPAIALCCAAIRAKMSSSS